MRPLSQQNSENLFDLCSRETSLSQYFPTAFPKSRLALANRQPLTVQAKRRVGDFQTALGRVVELPKEICCDEVWVGSQVTQLIDRPGRYVSLVQ